VVHSIDQTINYVEVFQIVQKVFRDRKLLLETCAMEVAEEIEKQIPDLEKLSITIRKVSPPITNFSGSVSVNYSKSYK
jgi:dihydroneopterin aldolase